MLLGLEETCYYPYECAHIERARAKRRRGSMMGKWNEKVLLSLVRPRWNKRDNCFGMIYQRITHNRHNYILFLGAMLMSLHPNILLPPPPATRNATTTKNIRIGLLFQYPKYFSTYLYVINIHNNLLLTLPPLLLGGNVMPIFYSQFSFFLSLLLFHT